MSGSGRNLGLQSLNTRCIIMKSFLMFCVILESLQHHKLASQTSLLPQKYELIFVNTTLVRFSTLTSISRYVTSSFKPSDSQHEGKGENSRLFSPRIFLQFDSLVLSNQKLPFLTIIVTQLLPNSSGLFSFLFFAIRFSLLGLNFISAEIKKNILEGNCLIIFCQFLSYINMSQPQAYIGSPPS